MKIEHKSPGGDDYYLVIASRDEVVVGGKPLPFSFYMGTIDPNGHIVVWTPAASVPKGYKQVAEAHMQLVCEDLRREGKVRGQA